ncbi:aldehyde dehydrogenase [Paenibacillus crassostreae]|uniref:Aldehyde dehydrogenase n=1 Tax=Paenibacillus crassostreae TaxID=1763538 RepID=A0A167DYL7_9BACL|nr:aldehyde dehydrogenase [Paenibacillus crassostreae]AOZ94523.1 aldehyde dehydrogenase [Paenibacillus crassostreae]OAB74934.1 aldehyde dehydrogenase [Paenibacillus crassostreae]
MDQYLQEHQQFFYSGQTRNIQFRLQQLSKLKVTIQRYEQQIISALYDDLRKSEFEAYATEIGFCLSSISHTMKHLKRWMKPQKVRTPIHQYPSKSYIVKEPYGTVLIVGPFNYPFQLLIEPLIGALATGNCIVLKPSENTPAVTTIIKKMIKETFNPSYIRVIEGEKETTSILIHAAFDYIFFTGSVPVGKIVMEAAAKNLTPVTLELGGKSPVIVDRTANIPLAAKRIIWGKLLNTGQTCIAPDYVLAHADIKQQLIEEMKHVITNFYGSDARTSKDYGRIVNERQFDRLVAIINKDEANILFGGHVDKDDLYIEPTLLATESWSDTAMQDEIFGPILPIMTYHKLEEAIQMIQSHPKPLSLYLFTEHKQVENEVLGRVSFGGGCVNDTISHVANTYLPFGGVGNAGIGAYHGQYSFDTFSHAKSILKKSTKFDLKVVFPPYGDKVKLVKKLLK